MPLGSALGRQRQGQRWGGGEGQRGREAERQRGRGISEFKVSLIYRAISRTAKAMQRNSVFKKTKAN